MEGVQAQVDREAAANLVRWWRDAGVDTLVDDAPRDWLARPARPVVQAIEQPAQRESSAGLPDSLEAMLAWRHESPDVPEAHWGGIRILPAGDRKADLMILTDLPEPGDAAAGVLMAGELGELFDKMLVAIGRDRSSIWLAPLATVRPVGGRMARDVVQRLVEIARRHISIVAPKRLLLMGDGPNRALIGPDWQARRGSLHSINLGEVSVETVATFHPRLLLERPAYKAQAWKDLQLLMKGL